MEVFGYHPDLKKWTEIGNSGIFRPEMLLPMGLPPDVRVIAWGLSLERPTMIKYRCKNIRELCVLHPAPPAQGSARALLPPLTPLHSQPTRQRTSRFGHKSQFEMSRSAPVARF